MNIVHVTSVSVCALANISKYGVNTNSRILTCCGFYCFTWNVIFTIVTIVTRSKNDFALFIIFILFDLRYIDIRHIFCQL